MRGRGLINRVGVIKDSGCDEGIECDRDEGAL